MLGTSMISRRYAKMTIATDRARQDNEQRTYVDIDGETFVKVTDDDLSEQIRQMNCLLTTLVEEQKKTNTYFAIITNQRL